jgi:uncharacterized protein (DUF488 family)
MLSQNKIIHTIRHSTRSSDEFINLLLSFNIRLLAYIRSYQVSERYPHFSKGTFQQTLPANQISYQHFPGMGGRRKALKHLKNIAWKDEAFRDLCII